MAGRRSGTGEDKLGAGIDGGTDVGAEDVCDCFQVGQFMNIRKMLRNSHQTY